jgi:hypothetical protein
MRTFGLELEFGDVVKSQVKLPDGYSWSVNERSIVNSNAKKSTPSGDLGGELNTRPLQRKLSDYRELKTVINNCFEANGKIMWNTGFDGHLYIGDKNLDDLKKIFLLGYYVSGVIGKVFNLGEWFNVEHLCPKPTWEMNQRIQNCDNLESIKNILANSSNVGHYRYEINIMPYFKTKTLEFRLFNGTKDFRETLETINFMYSFLEYALTKSEDDFKKLNTEEAFRETFGIKYKLPKKTAPLIFAPHHSEAVRNISRAFPISRKVIVALKNNTAKKVSLVNPYNYTTALAIYKEKELKIFNNLEFNHIVFKIATGELIITYENHFELLNKYKDGRTATELSLFYIFNKTHKYNQTEEYGISEWNSFITKIDESIAKIEVASNEIINMFKHSTYINGNLNDALAFGDDVIYQQEHNSKSSGTVHALKKNSNYAETDFIATPTEYHDLKVNGKMLVVSKCEFLDYHKIVKDLNIYIYSTEKEYVGMRINDDKETYLSIKTPSDDFVINEQTPITITEIPTTVFSKLQARFVKKVTKFSRPVFSYAVMSDDIVLGAIGLEWSKDSEYGIFVLSDFCTNNDVKQLSKLILFILQTDIMKRAIERKAVNVVEKGYTLVYTTRPVSMKYRGAFKKVKTDSHKSLKYEFELGSMGTMKDAIREYIKRSKN